MLNKRKSLRKSHNNFKRLIVISKIIIYFVPEIDRIETN